MLLFWLILFAFAAGGASLYIQKVFSQQGMVKGILYAQEESSAVVDNQIVREGDVINGAKIVRIEKFTVQFHKDGYQWKQRVGEKPNPAWDTVESENR